MEKSLLEVLRFYGCEAFLYRDVEDAKDWSVSTYYSIYIVLPYVISMLEYYILPLRNNHYLLFPPNILSHLQRSA